MNELILHFSIKICFNLLILSVYYVCDNMVIYKIFLANKNKNSYNIEGEYFISQNI